MEGYVAVRTTRAHAVVRAEEEHREFRLQRLKIKGINFLVWLDRNSRDLAC